MKRAIKIVLPGIFGHYGIVANEGSQEDSALHGSTTEGVLCRATSKAPVGICLPGLFLSAALISPALCLFRKAHHRQDPRDFQRSSSLQD